MLPAFLRVGLALLLALATGLVNTATAAETVQLSFGVYQSDKATSMYRKFLPVLEYLQDNLEQTLGVPVDIQLTIFKDYAQANDALVDGSVDFVRFGPASYILAKQRSESIQLIAMEEVKGEKRFKGLIVVRNESPIQSLPELKGRTFAFGDKASTIGRYLSQAVLIDAGIHAGDLAAHDYLDRHDKVFKAVEMGDYDAGALKEDTFHKMNRDGRLRILSTFENVTKPWIARAGLEQKTLDAIRKGLLALKDKEILKIFKASAYLPSRDDEYAFVRAGMAASEGF